MEIAQYILSLFRRHITTVFSWGYHNPVAIENGLEFAVDGYKHKGKVRVQYNEGLDLFSIKIINNDGCLKDHADEVYFDALVDTIDDMVEKVSDYGRRVKEQYGLNI